MYARVATFDNTDLEGLRNLLSTDISLLPDGTRAAICLRDPHKHLNLFITLFDTREAIHAAETAFDDLGERIPERDRGRRTAVRAYEVILDDHDTDTTTALVTILNATAREIDQASAYAREQLLPRSREQSACRGALVLADPDRREGKFITFWHDDAPAPCDLDHLDVAFNRHI
jgi:hypothetical protein